MKLDEAKKILGSVGYSVSENLDSYVKNTVKSLMESLESRRATKTKSYQILSEMARFNGRYTGSFAGLEGAGTVELTVKGQSKEFGVAEALSKVENDFKSANSKGMSQKTAENLLANFDAALAAFPETGNQEYLEELKKEREYISQCVEDGDGIPQGGWTDQGLARTTHSRDDSALDAKKLIKNIQNSITSFSRGGSNADLIKDRIDQLMARADELTAEEREKVEGLYTKLDIAVGKNRVNAVASGKVSIFKPATPGALMRVRIRLNNGNIKFTENEDGSLTIKKKQEDLEDLIGEYGEFIVPEAPAASASDNDLWIEFANEEEAQIAAEEIFPNVNVTSEIDGAVVHITGTPAALRRATTALQTNGLEVQVIDTPATTVEESTKVDENEEQINEGLFGNKFGRTKHDLNEALVAELKDVPAGDRKKIIYVLNDNGFGDRVKEYGFKADDDLGEFWFGVAQVLGFVPSHCEDLGNGIVKINGKKCKSALDAYKTIVFTSEVEGANEVDESYENYLDVAARLTDYGSI